MDLLSDGYTDIKMVGINGYQYVSNDYHCMICDTPDDCNNCDDIRILPWVQDIPSILISDYTNEELCVEQSYDWGIAEQIMHDMDQFQCESNGYTFFHDFCIEYVYGCTDEVDVWGNWDISLRDLVVVNKQGFEVARINLTNTNPDPNSSCGENYVTIKQLIIDAR